MPGHARRSVWRLFRILGEKDPENGRVRVSAKKQNNGLCKRIKGKYFVTFSHFSDFSNLFLKLFFRHFLIKKKFQKEGKKRFFQKVKIKEAN